MKTRNIESVQTLIDNLQNIFLEKEYIKDKAGTVSGETLSIYLNSKTSQDIKESPWVALHLRYPTKSVNAE